VNQLVTGKVSLDRVNNFLKNVSNKVLMWLPILTSTQTELLDAFEAKAIPVLFPTDASTDVRIGFRNATFSWSKESSSSLTSSQRQFVLKIDGEILFERGRINLVVGPTGSGAVRLVSQIIMLMAGRQNFASNGAAGYVERHLRVWNVADMRLRRDALDSVITGFLV
jgi:hypothetical protein